MHYLRQAFYAISTGPFWGHSAHQALGPQISPDFAFRELHFRMVQFVMLKFFLTNFHAVVLLWAWEFSRGKCQCPGLQTAWKSCGDGPRFFGFFQHFSAKYLRGPPIKFSLTLKLARRINGWKRQHLCHPKTKFCQFFPARPRRCFFACSHVLAHLISINQIPPPFAAGFVPSLPYMPVLWLPGRLRMSFSQPHKIFFETVDKILKSSVK